MIGRTAKATTGALSYTSSAQLSSLNFQTSSGGALAAEQFGYDANLRTTSATATWGANSGQSGTIFSQGLSYDPASNLVSLTSTQNAAGNGTGGRETSNFCYDEQNRLVWAGNSGTQPGAGNGTCGSGTLASGLTGANYSNTYVYTHLGQLWQGPLPGGSTQEQYLYCASNTHQLVGLYPTTSGATCSNYSTKTAGYSSSYDGFGNVASRMANNTTGTLTYDILDHLTQWSAGSSNQEQYLYDASGQRMLRRFTNNNGTTILTYPFGIEEHQYSGAGSNQWNISYYFLAGRLLGSLDGNGTQFYLVDSLGSLVSAFTNAQGGASMKSNQLFGPYGNVRYYAGNLNTAKGFLGQYNDGSGLDYFHARYYDPVVGVFLSADTVLGNGSGENPYAYVGGNPETYSDPTGQIPTMPCPYCYSYIPKSNSHGSASMPNWAFFGLLLMVDAPAAPVEVVTSAALTGGIALLLGIAWLYGQLHHSSTSGTVPQPHPTSTPTPNTGCCAIDVAFQDSGTGISIQPHTSPPPTQTGSSGGGIIPPPPVSAPGAACSFTSDTRVRTQQGEKAIGKLHVGDKVLAYNPKTHKMEQEPILHVWINHDTDLVDLTLTTTNPAQHGKAATKMSETIHTNQKHPFFTLEKGFLPVGQIKLRMHVLRANGTYGVVTGWKVVPGTQVMYNLEVAQDHTFTVGAEQWVVHNCNPDLLQNPQARNAAQATANAFSDHFTPDDLSGAWRDLHGDPVPRDTGGFYEHLQEVNNAIRSGKNTLTTFSRLLDRGALSENDICIVQCLYGRISRTLDYVENIINRDIWTPGANVLDWWSR